MTTWIVSGPWTIAPRCEDHGDSPEERIRLEFMDGRVHGGSESTRIEGSFGPDGRMILRLERANGSVEQWLGVPVGEAIVGTWRDVVPQRGSKTRCQGTFRLWPCAMAAASA